MGELFFVLDYPLAYLISFRTYGTWLHGDERSSVERHGYNIYGTPLLPPNPRWEAAERERLKHPPFEMAAPHREAVDDAIREVCWYRGYTLSALAVRTNHVHIVATAQCPPEPMMTAFKAYATRKMRERGLIGSNIHPWVRHGSTRWLWTPEAVAGAVNYVEYGQGEPL
jgi:REP element-mobilizing transposase RayT